MLLGLVQTQGGSWAHCFCALPSAESITPEQSSQQSWGSFSDPALSYPRLRAKISPPASPLNSAEAVQRGMNVC